MLPSEMTKRTNQTCNIHMSSAQRLRKLFTIEDVFVWGVCKAKYLSLFRKDDSKIQQKNRITVGHVIDETNVSTQLRKRACLKIQIIKPTFYLDVDHQHYSKTVNVHNTILRWPTLSSIKQ